MCRARNLCLAALIGTSVFASMAHAAMCRRFATPEGTTWSNYEAAVTPVISAIRAAFPGLQATRPSMQEGLWALGHDGEAEACRIIAQGELAEYESKLASARNMAARQSPPPVALADVPKLAASANSTPPFSIAGNINAPPLDKDTAQRLAKIQGQAQVIKNAILVVGWPNPYAAGNMMKPLPLGSIVRVLSVYRDNSVHVTVLSRPDSSLSANVRDEGVLLFSEVGLAAGQTLPPEPGNPPPVVSERPLTITRATPLPASPTTPVQFTSNSLATDSNYSQFNIIPIIWAVVLLSSVILASYFSFIHPAKSLNWRTTPELRGKSGITRNVWKSDSIRDYRQNFSMKDPNTGETCWRMTSNDGSVSDLVTRRSADQFRVDRLSALSQRILPPLAWGILGLAIGVSGSFIFHALAPGVIGIMLFLISGASVFESAWVYVNYALRKETVEHQFINYMSQLEAAAQHDIQLRQDAGLPILGQAEPAIAGQSPRKANRVSRPSDDL